MVLRILLFVVLFILTPLANAEYEYDASSDNHVLNNINFGSNDEYTICFWAWDNSWTAGHEIVGYGNGVDSSNGRGWNIVVTGTRALRVNQPSAGLTNQGSSANNIVSNSTWHHLCFVNKPSSFEIDLYIDATDDTADHTYSIGNGDTQSSTDDFYVAGVMPEYTGAGYVNASIHLAHVAYWTVALTASEVGDLADKSTCPADIESSNLEVFLKLTEGTVVDSSDNAFSVTENGNPVLESNLTGLPSCSSGSTNFMPILTEIMGY